MSTLNQLNVHLLDLNAFSIFFHGDWTLICTCKSCFRKYWVPNNLVEFANMDKADNISKLFCNKKERLISFRDREYKKKHQPRIVRSFENAFRI